MSSSRVSIVSRERVFRRVTPATVAGGGSINGNRGTGLGCGTVDETCGSGKTDISSIAVRSGDARDLEDIPSEPGILDRCREPVAERKRHAGTLGAISTALI